MNFEQFLLCLINALLAMGYSLIAPLYPSIALSHSVSLITIGFVMASSSIFQILTISYSIFILKNYERKKVFIIGTILCSTCTLTYGFLNFINNKALFLFVSFGSRILDGFGTGIVYPIIYSVISRISSENELKQNIGYMEFFWNAGFTCGPVIITIFYYFGGYTLPFAIAALCRYSVLLTLFYIPMDDESEELNKKDDKNVIDNDMNERLLENNENENLNQNSSLSSDSIFPIIYNSYRILLYVLSVIVITNSTTFYFPTLTEYLKNSYGLTVTMSSLFFLGNSVSYLISLQFINQISNYFGNIPIMAISLIFNGFGCLLIPPIGILPFSSIITFIGIFINGFFSSFINVNMFIVSGDELKRMDNRATETQKSDISSALFNASLNIADLIAPILGAYITSKINFGWSAYVSGSFCFILSILFIKEYEKIKKEL